MRPPPPAALRHLERELALLEQRRDDLDRAIARLRRTATWLRRSGRRGKGAARAGGGGPASLTSACRAALRLHAPEGLTPKEVRRLLTESEFPWERFVNPMAAVHTVLKRLVRQGEAATTIGRDGQRRYATKRTVSFALTTREARNEALLKELLEAESPEAVAAVLKKRRTQSE